MTASNRGASDELSGLIEIDIDLDMDSEAPASDAEPSVAGPDIDIEFELTDEEPAGEPLPDDISDEEIVEVTELVDDGIGVRAIDDQELEDVPDDEAYDLFELVDSSMSSQAVPPPLPPAASADFAASLADPLPGVGDAPPHPVLDLVEPASIDPVVTAPAMEPVSPSRAPASTDDAPAVLGRLDIGKARRQFVKELQRKNEELESQLLALHAETVVSHDRVERQSQKMEEMQGRLKATEGQLAALGGADEGSAEVLQELARMRAEMEASAQAAEARVAELESRLEEASEREAAASIQAASYAEEAEVFSAREATFTAKIKALEAQLADTRVSLASMQGATDSEKELAIQNESLRFRMATLEAAVGLAETTAQEHRSHAMDLERELEVARSLAENAEEDKNAAVAVAASLKTKLDTLTVDVAALTARVEVAEDAREEAEADNAELTKSREEAVVRLAELEANAADQATALAAAFTNAQEAVDAAAEEKKRADAADLQIVALSAANVSALGQIRELENNAETLQRSLDRAREDLSDLEAERTVVDRKLAAAEERQAVVEATVAEAKARVAEAESAQTAAEERAQTLTDEIEGMQAELKAARVQAQGAEALADKVGALKAKLEVEIEKADERHTAQKAAEEALAAEKAAHEAAMAAAQEAHAAEMAAAAEALKAAEEAAAAVEDARAALEATVAEQTAQLEEQAARSGELEAASTEIEKLRAAVSASQAQAEASAEAADALGAQKAELANQIAEIEATRDEALQLAEALGEEVDALSTEVEVLKAQADMPGDAEALATATARVEELEAALASVRADVPSIDLDLRLDEVSMVDDVDLDPGELEAVTSGDEGDLVQRIAQLESELSLARDALAAMPPSLPTQDVDEAMLEELAAAREESRELKARVVALESSTPMPDAKTGAEVEALREEYADLAEAFEDLQQSHFERGKQLMNSLAEGERMRANLVRIAQELSAVREEADALSRHAEDLESEKRHNTGVIEQLHEQLAAVVDDANAVAAIPPLGSPSRPLTPSGSNRRPQPEDGVSLFGIGDDDLAFENSKSRIPEFRGGSTQFGAPSMDEPAPEPSAQRWTSSGEGVSTETGREPALSEDDDLFPEEDDLGFGFDDEPSAAQDGVDPIAALESMGVLDVAPTSDLGAARGLDHRAGFLLSMVDGHTTVRDLIDISGMPVDDVCRLIKSLFDAGALRS